MHIFLPANYKLNHFFLCLAFAFLLSLTNVSGQSNQFSQYYASPLYLNPALAGAIPDLSFYSIYRSQWRSISVPYTTTQASLLVPMYRGVTKEHIGGGGISIINDRAGNGQINTLGINGTLAYNIILSEDTKQTLSFGLQGGVVQKRIEMSDGWGSQFNPFIGQDANIPVDETAINNVRLFPEVGAGILWQYNPDRDYTARNSSAYAGFSGYHLNSPNESLLEGQSSFLPRLFKFHSGMEYSLGERTSISFNLLGVYQQPSYQINVGSYITYRIMEDKGGLLGSSDIIFGSWYRLNDAFIFMTGISHKYYTLGFSYDLNTSSLNYFTRGRGAYEISLSVRMKRSDKEIKSYSTPRF